MKEGEENLGDWRNTWGKREFIQRWIAKGDWQGPIRQLQTDMVLRMIPHALEAPIRVLDLGAGYGALAGAVLNERPHATAVCLDVSMEMLELGKERNKTLEDRIMFIQGSLENPDWLKMLEGTFDAVISSRALHHFTPNQRRRDIFKESYEISRAGGCFINADNVRAPTATLRERYGKARDEWLDRQVRESSGGKTTLREIKASSPSAYHGPHDNGRLDEELAWLKEAGFEDVDCFWKLGTAVVYGGFRP